MSLVYQRTFSGCFHQSPFVSFVFKVGNEFLRKKEMKPKKPSVLTVTLPPNLCISGGSPFFGAHEPYVFKCLSRERRMLRRQRAVLQRFI